MPGSMSQQASSFCFARIPILGTLFFPFQYFIYPVDPFQTDPFTAAHPHPMDGADGHPRMGRKGCCSKKLWCVHWLRGLGGAMDRGVLQAVGVAAGQRDGGCFLG